MHFRIFAGFALLGSTIALPTVGKRVTPCTASYRESQLNGVAPAFNAPDPETAAFLEQLPLKPNSELILYINGAPGITVAPTAATVRAFAFGVRQIFYKVTITSNPPSTDYGNGTTHTVLEIVTGVISAIALPVSFQAGMNFNYDLSDCEIETLQGFLTIPNSVLGVPIDPTLVVDAILAAGNAGTLPAN